VTFVVGLPSVDPAVLVALETATPGPVTVVESPLTVGGLVELIPSHSSDQKRRPLVCLFGFPPGGVETGSGDAVDGDVVTGAADDGAADDGAADDGAAAFELLGALQSLLDHAQAGGIGRFVTITTVDAAEPDSDRGLFTAAAERLTVTAARRASTTGGPLMVANVVRSGSAVGRGAGSGPGPDEANSSDDGATDLTALLVVALSGDCSRVVLGPPPTIRPVPLSTASETAPGRWGSDEIAVPGPVTGVWQSTPPPLDWPAVEAVWPAKAAVAADPSRSDASGVAAAAAGLRSLLCPQPAPSMSVLLSPPEVAGREQELVRETLDSGWLAPAGPQLDHFEAELSNWVDGQPVVALSSGTAALHLALVVVGVKPGDEVVVQTATFAASAFAVVHAGAVPVFCDINEATGNLDPDLLAECLQARAAAGRLPKAVVSVDLYGLCADYRRLREVCDRHGVPLIQDAAESLGSTAEGTAAGAHGDLGILSFNGNKIITTSGGGALTGPPELVEHARRLSTQARQPGLHYEHSEIGYNYRLSGVLASLGRAQLETLPTRMARKAELHQRYVAALPTLDWFPSGVTERWNHWLSVALLPEHLPPHFVCRTLAAAGVECRPFWKPMHRQPVFSRSEAWITGPADGWYRRGLCLPSGFGLTDANQDLVIGELLRVLSV